MHDTYLSFLSLLCLKNVCNRDPVTNNVAISNDTLILVYKSQNIYLAQMSLNDFPFELIDSTFL